MQRFGLIKIRPFTLRLGVWLLSFFSLSAALACSTVAFRHQEVPLLAYNFDFEATGAGFLVINPAGAAKGSVMDGNRATWRSRFGSITVNQIGPGMPAAGMNTAGLVVTLMWNEDATYPDPGTAPVVSELEFIQRLLDTSGSVAEALAKINGVGIQGLVPIHYFLFDATGDAAIILPDETELVVYHGNALPIAALTNTSYAKALSYLEASPGPDAQPDGPASLDRFRTGAKASQSTEERTPAQAFDVLDQLTNSSTRWQMVFEPVTKRITLRVGGPEGETSLALGDTDFVCGQRPLGIDLGKVRPDFSAASFTPIDPGNLAATMGEVLSSMKGTAHLGRPQIAAGLAAGPLASSVCSP